MHYRISQRAQLHSPIWVKNRQQSTHTTHVVLRVRTMAATYLTSDTVSNNTASDNGGGIYNANGMFLTNLTLYANKANGNGGGIFNDQSNAYPKNTIVAMNQSVDGNCSSSEFAAVVSQGHNLDSDDTCRLTATDDITVTGPLLGPLRDNGGDTLTHALLTGSPAIDKGDDGSCPATDQRGLPRTQGAACDIGAYEFGETADLSICKQRQESGVVAAGGRITYTVTITNAGPTTPVTATVVDTWTPIDAVVGLDAPGCAVDLGGGIITCTRTDLRTRSVLFPGPHIVFTASATFSGKLTNIARIATIGDITDSNPENNVRDPVVVTVIRNDGHLLYLPLVGR